MTIESASLEDRLTRSAQPREPLDPETVEMLLAELEKILARVNRICNTVLNHPQGIPEAAIDALQMIKLSESHLRWHLEHRGGA